MNEAQTELPERAEESHLFGDDLSGGEECDGFRAVLGFDFLEPFGEKDERAFPIDGLEFAGVIVAEKRSGRAVSGGERRKRFPPLWAGHPEVYRVLGFGAEIHCFAVLEMHLQSAT